MGGFRPFISRLRISRRCCAATLAVVAALLCAPPVRGQIVDRPVTGEQVRAALRRGVDAIKRRQRNDGTWPARFIKGGETCLATFALLQAGERPDSPVLRDSLEFIRKLPDEDTYVVSLKVQVLAEANPRRYRREIREAVNWIVRAQQNFGLWGYNQDRGHWDHSNSQFALLALHAAAEHNFNVPRTVWQKAQRAVLATQNADAGWTYRASGESYGSMTAANLSNLIILGNTPVVAKEDGFRNGAAPNCGRFQANRPLENGFGWLAQHFAADRNPRRGRRYTYYWLYAVERVGILSGRQSFGLHEWYREGAAYLVRDQNVDGTWGGSLVDTCFGVLFLAKGHKSLAIQKLAWSDDGSWNLDPHDVRNLVDFIGDDLGQPIAWQSIEFEQPLEQWLKAPLLYMQGHEFPGFTPPQLKKLREFVDEGGTLFVEACCSRPEVRVGFERFARVMFPNHPLRELDASHAVYHALHEVEPHGLYGIDVGCRTSVIFSPHDLSCLWEQGDIPILSEKALKLGANIVAFATGRQGLRDRLDVVTLPASEPEAQDTKPPGDPLHLGQVVYNGDWRPDPAALVHFAEYLRDQLNMPVVTQYQAVHLRPETVRHAPILFLTGHYDFSLSESELTALREHLERGGFLLAEACCGRAAMDSAVRRMLKQLFPDHPLERLPKDHPIFKGEPGFALNEVKYKEAVLQRKPGFSEPELWGIEFDGRLAVVYSPYSLGCSLDGHRCFNCRGVRNPDARRLAANVVLHALTR